jgi:hypothetical protein
MRRPTHRSRIALFHLSRQLNTAKLKKSIAILRRRQCSLITLLTLGTDARLTRFNTHALLIHARFRRMVYFACLSPLVHAAKSLRLTLKVKPRRKLQGSGSG